MRPGAAQEVPEIVADTGQVQANTSPSADGPRRPSGWKLAAKRTADVVVAGVGLLVLSPLLLLLMLLVRLTSAGPAIYRQTRLGKDARPFTLLKLRTMVRGAEGMGAGLAITAGDSRITPLGKILRATSLDELPQLWNVLRGDMSLVGPRPLPVRYLERYSARQRRRMEMPQGVTGWSQVRARNAGSWHDRLEMDVSYIDSWSLGLDIRILAETLWKVVARRGVSAEDGTVAEFQPENKDNGEGAA